MGGMIRYDKWHRESNRYQDGEERRDSEGQRYRPTGAGTMREDDICNEVADRGVGRPGTCDNTSIDARSGVGSDGLPIIDKSIPLSRRKRRIR